MAHLKITDASGRQWQFSFLPNVACTIGRAPDNTVVLDDPRASRYHAHINQAENGTFTIVDGAVRRSFIERLPIDSALRPETLPRRTIKHAGDTATKFD